MIPSSFVSRIRIFSGTGASPVQIKSTSAQARRPRYLYNARMLRLTRAQVRQIDRRAIEEYHIPGIVLMENAARAAADVALSMIDPAKPMPVTIVCGGGNNGGDGLAVARHFSNRGIDVLLVLTVAPDRFAGDAAINWEIVRLMGITWWKGEIPNWPLADGMIIDAILGTGLTEPPRPAAERAIKRINAAKQPVLAIDVPSGLDCDTGKPLGPCVKATKTITFVAEKVGFANPEAHEYLGEVVIGDIGAPRKLIEGISSINNQ
jgi:NAD(P)H-hydrate epimerase